MVRLSDTVIILSLIAFEQFVAGKQCNPHSMRDVACKQNETCTATGFCECKVGFKLINDTCLNITTTKDAPDAQPVIHSSTEESTSNHVAAGILIPLFLITVVICGVFLNHKYRIISWIRNKIDQRNMNYDEVMIGQDLEDDDPPLH